MKKYDQIHETVLKTVIDVFSDIKALASDPEKRKLFTDGLKDGAKGNSNYMKSIARGSNDLICAFPVLSSRNISMNTQSIVAKAIEKNCVSMLQMLFAACQIETSGDVRNYLSNFHSNINKNSNLVDIGDVVTLMGEATADECKITNTDKMLVREDMRFINTYLGSNVNTRSISESFSCSMNAKGNYIVSAEKQKSITEAGAKNDDVKNKKDYSEFFKNQVLPSEYKKANELMPTMMTINFKVVGNGTNAVTVDNAVVGVKAKLYPVSSEDMISHLASRAKDSNWMNKLMKLSTGEISFFRDFLFAIDKCKVDAMSYSTKSPDSKMWHVLRRRANRSTWNQLWNRRNDAIAITTLMISQNEVDYIKKEFGIDISMTRVARDLISHYNLLGICIVDESLEIAKFMYDTGDDLWETIPFSSLEREASDNTYKKVVNLMTKQL